MTYLSYNFVSYKSVSYKSVNYKSINYKPVSYKSVSLSKTNCCWVILSILTLYFRDNLLQLNLHQPNSIGLINPPLYGRYKLPNSNFYSQIKDFLHQNEDNYAF